MNSKSRYKRILLKLSGEALMGEREYGIDPKVLEQFAADVVESAALGVQIGIVVGGGNIFEAFPAARKASAACRVTKWECLLQ